MKFKKISTKLLLTIIPVILLAMGILTFVSMESSKTIIDEQIAASMEAELRAQDGAMSKYLDSVSDMATVIAAMVETNYTSTELKEYEKVLANIIAENAIVLGSGLWFEPYVYDPEEKYIGPYVYKDGTEIVTTYDYSNAEYNYFSQEYYTMCLSAEKAQFTNPYYDATSDTIMASCACPILANGTYLGCVTVDIELGTITELVEDIRIGTNGRAVLLSTDGVYLAGTDAKKIQQEEKMTEDENVSVATAGSEILKNASGTATCQQDGETLNLYYSTLANTGWKLVLNMPQSELNEPIYELVSKLAVLMLAAVIVTFVIVLVQITKVAKNIRLVQLFAASLAEGNFTIDSIRVKSADELGNLGKALNQMYDSNKNVIWNIKHHAGKIKNSSLKLKEASQTLDEKFGTMQSYMANVNSAMLSASAATEEVNASAEEVFSNVNLLAEQAENSMQMAQMIQDRAGEVGKNSREAFASATRLSEQFEKKLQASIENTKVVESIGQLADVISEIADQINLLSLNASIEAARAGDAGRGFAVVAGEIGTLAGNTSEAVSQIQSTIAEVKAAFHSLTEDSRDMLSFVQNTVAPDYNNFVEVAGQYGQDAENITGISNQVSAMSDAIKHIMGEVTDAIQNIAGSTQQTTELCARIMASIDVVSRNITDISELSHVQDAVVTDLNEVASKFRVE